MFQKRLICKPNYKFNLTYDNNGDPEWECILSVKGYDDYYGYATTKKEAQREAFMISFVIWWILKMIMNNFYWN